MIRIWEKYQYLFYKYYTWNIWLNRGKDPYGYQAGWSILSILMCVNFLTLLVVIEIFSGSDLLQIGYTKLNVISIFTIASIFNYFLFLYKRKYKKIIIKFEKEDSKSKINGNIFAWSYLLISLGILFLTAFISHYFLPPPAINGKSIEASPIAQPISSNQRFFPDNDKLVLPVVKNAN